ncbi:unnamed protein product [Rotaria sordida]|uniref:Ubiquitin-like domain-containing protein n=2 Tax=Rotaria sordida TaxID=392033 RepID=A0A819GVW4_9BILA|nr:unnamed protein product [Rotaria sordida]
MTNTDIKSRFYIVHLEVAHGSDRYDIHLHMEHSPLVRDLMEEVEKKARVTMMNQQLLYRGQRLHMTPDEPLENFGLFNGNRIILVGEKLTGIEDEHFRRLLSVEKDVKVINDVIELVCRDFENLKQSQQSRDRCEQLLRDLQSHGERCRSDLKTFQSIASNLKIEQSEIDAYRKKNQVNALIQKMGFGLSKLQLMVKAIENQDASELRTVIKDLSSIEIRNLCKSYVPSDEYLCTILHYVAWQDNPDLLAPLLDYVDELEMRDGHGWTPLMTAVNRGSKQNVRMLLARGAQIDCDWVGGMSLVADAMNFGDVELITILMDHGARVAPTPDMLDDSQNENAFYLLHYAVDDGYYDIAKLLIEKGKIPMNTLDQSGWSPMHLAAGHNNIDILTLLIEKGADINVKDSDGNTPLAWARELDATEAVTELQARGGIADKIWHGEKPELKTLEEREQEAIAEDNDDQDAEEKKLEAKINGIEHDRFEIEVEDAKLKPPKYPNGKDFKMADGLQRQRSDETY